MNIGSCPHGTSHKHNERFRGSFGQFLEVKEDLSVVGVDKINITVERIREATPERRTGSAYNASTLREAARFPFWFLANPTGRTEKRALV